MKKKTASKASITDFEQVKKERDIYWRTLKAICKLMFDEDDDSYIRPLESGEFGDVFARIEKELDDTKRKEKCRQTAFLRIVSEMNRRQIQFITAPDRAYTKRESAHREPTNSAIDVEAEVIRDEIKLLPAPKKDL